MPDLIIRDKVHKISQYLNGFEHHSKDISLKNLELLENSLPDAGFRYVIIQKNGTTIFFAYFQLFTLTSGNFNTPKNKGFARGILNFFLKLKKVKVLILGNPLRNETISYAYDNHVLNKEQAIEALTLSADIIAGAEKVSATLLKGINYRDPSIEPFMVSNGYIEPWNDLGMEMEIDSSWKNLQDYFNTLTRKYKTRANKIVSVSKGLVVKSLSEEQIIEYQDDIHRLFSEVVHKQSFKLTQPSPGYFAGLKAYNQEAFEVKAFFLDEQLVAFYTAFHTDESYEIYYAGFDYNLNNQHQLYFNILFSGLDSAIRYQKKRLVLGRTSFDAKASLGAQPKKMDYAIKLTDIPDFVIHWFICYFSSLEDSRWKQRNPLKNKQPEQSSANIHESLELTDSLV